MTDDFKDMIRERMRQESVLPDHLVRAAEGYRVNFETMGTAGPIADQFGDFSEETAVTGLYFPEDGLMLVDSRLKAHHNNQWDWVMRNRGEMSPVLPWASAVSFDGGFTVELGRSHGGLTQALNRGGHRNVDTLTNGAEITPEMVLDVAYAARLSDHPPDGTEYDVEFQRESIDDIPPGMKFEMGWERHMFDMADVYDLLRTSPAGLPEPLFERGGL